MALVAVVGLDHRVDLLLHRFQVERSRILNDFTYPRPPADRVPLESLTGPWPPAPVAGFRLPAATPRCPIGRRLPSQPTSTALRPKPASHGATASTGDRNDGVYARLTTSDRASCSFTMCFSQRISTVPPWQRCLRFCEPCFGGVELRNVSGKPMVSLAFLPLARESSPLA